MCLKSEYQLLHLEIRFRFNGNVLQLYGFWEDVHGSKYKVYILYRTAMMASKRRMFMSGTI
jgi:hypothetical protein